MPAVKGYEDIIWARPGSNELERLNERWINGDFTLKIIGIILLSNGMPRPISVFVSGCCAPQDVAEKLVIGLDPSPDAFYPDEIVWRCPTEPGH